jgi:hypothetical protein
VASTRARQVGALFAWLISHQPAVLFSQNKPVSSNQPAVLISQNEPAPAISHQPNEQAVERQLQAVQSLLVDADAKSETNTFELWKGRLQKSLASRDIC